LRRTVAEVATGGCKELTTALADLRGEFPARVNDKHGPSATAGELGARLGTAIATSQIFRKL
jgi:hypothetical protein